MTLQKTLQRPVDLLRKLGTCERLCLFIHQAKTYCTALNAELQWRSPIKCSLHVLQLQMSSGCWRSGVLDAGEENLVQTVLARRSRAGRESRWAQGEVCLHFLLLLGWTLSLRFCMSLGFALSWGNDYGGKMHQDILWKCSSPIATQRCIDTNAGFYQSCKSPEQIRRQDTRTKGHNW